MRRHLRHGRCRWCHPQFTCADCQGGHKGHRGPAQHKVARYGRKRGGRGRPFTPTCDSGGVLSIGHGVNDSVNFRTDYYCTDRTDNVNLPSTKPALRWIICQSKIVHPVSCAPRGLIERTDCPTLHHKPVRDDWLSQREGEKREFNPRQRGTGPGHRLGRNFPQVQLVYATTTIRHKHRWRAHIDVCVCVCVCVFCVAPLCLRYAIVSAAGKSRAPRARARGRGRGVCVGGGLLHARV